MPSFVLFQDLNMLYGLISAGAAEGGYPGAGTVYFVRCCTAGCQAARGDNNMCAIGDVVALPVYLA